MDISDDVRAANALERIGYYRLSGYWYPFRDFTISTGSDGRPATKMLDNFLPEAMFSDALDLYVFDKKLRLLMLDAIERVEIGLRVEIALLLSNPDPWAHRDHNRLHPRFVRSAKHNHSEWVSRIDKLAGRSKEEFVTAYRAKYSDPLPLWMSIEVWDFGCLSMFLSGMKDGDLNQLAAKYGLKRRNILTSWVRSINGVRNVAAHHMRLWNRTLVDQPEMPRVGEMPLLDHVATDQLAREKLYATAVALRWLLRTINPTTTWPERLKDHFTRFPKNRHFKVTQTGFPMGWESFPVWN